MACKEQTLPIPPRSLQSTFLPSDPIMLTFFLVVCHYFPTSGFWHIARNPLLHILVAQPPLSFKSQLRHLFMKEALTHSRLGCAGWSN